MTVSKAQMKATAKYQKKNYDNLALRIKKGKKELYKALADKKGVSLSALIQNLLDMECEKEGL